MVRVQERVLSVARELEGKGAEEILIRRLCINDTPLNMYAIEYLCAVLGRRCSLALIVLSEMRLDKMSDVADSLTMQSRQDSHGTLNMTFFLLALIAMSM